MTLEHQLSLSTLFTLSQAFHFLLYSSVSFCSSPLSASAQVWDPLSLSSHHFLHSLPLSLLTSFHPLIYHLSSILSSPHILSLLPPGFPVILISLLFSLLGSLFPLSYHPSSRHSSLHPLSSFPSPTVGARETSFVQPCLRRDRFHHPGLFVHVICSATLRCFVLSSVFVVVLTDVLAELDRKCI